MLCVVFFFVLSVVVSSRQYIYNCKTMAHSNPGKIFASFISWVTLAGILFHHADAFKIAPPEFADPVKNISVPAGSNIGFFCNVINLGGNRVSLLNSCRGNSRFCSEKLLADLDEFLHGLRCF